MPGILVEFFFFFFFPYDVRYLKPRLRGSLRISLEQVFFFFFFLRLEERQADDLLPSSLREQGEL